MAFAALSGPAVPILNLGENIRGEDVTPGGRLRLDDYGCRGRDGIAAARNHGIGIENIVEDTNVICTRTEVEHLSIV